ncbi:GNAT family N-acetyltransferase [Streptomyces sp. ME02-8801-2C]|uniref:GNAT family N-acetyltransferase n=1 Tax=Streptomyces sp. ME02-8801-2C TaxID=3028680 RepID=UPI0029BCD9A1|nr:GNAT family N-acetyltransferase [Streptomyces sp. ME02-8801-2C]MDX3451339.1 GNAT family N-acetyltransferase [Streptomyces sp. ME02-8801-2C]
MNDPILVRAMVHDDCERVSEIRIRGWQHAYKGLMPQPYLDALSVSEDAERRRTFFVRAGSEVVNLVAERAGEIIGWACHGPYRDGEIRTDDAELYAIYVDVGQFGAGVGQALLREAADRCADAGHRRMFLWVIEGNDRARRFYERAGFTADGAEEPFDVDGVAVREVRYVRELLG